MVFWNARQVVDNAYLQVLGIAFLFVGALDMLHTLAYKGMGVFTTDDANLPTQLWIATRYLQSLSFLVAAFFLGRRAELKRVFPSYTLVFLLVLGMIFYWRIFPDAYVEDSGLTPFKRISEYLISLILGASLVVLYRNRERFEPGVLQLLTAAMIVSIASELAFTSYVSVYDSFNMVGHLLKIVAFFLIYQAFVVVGIQQPYNLIFRNLVKTEQALRDLNASLETQVAVRTAQVHGLTSALVSAEQEERQRIAQVLHDEVQQLLYSQLMRLQLLRDALPTAGDSALNCQLDDMAAVTHQAVRLTRNLVSELRPPAFITDTLEEELTWLAGQMKDAHGLRTEITVCDPCPMENQDLRTLLVRVVRELLFNIVKHAGVKEARLSLWQQENNILMCIEDHGVGFDAEALWAGEASARGTGLLSVAERLELINGSLDVDAKPGAGTRITICVPAFGVDGTEARCTASL
jgi:signal transduction histidine kinase